MIKEDELNEKNQKIVMLQKENDSLKIQIKDLEEEKTVLNEK